MENLLIILLNIIITSSIMCLADRINHNVPILTPRSFCFHCKHHLAWFDLIPIFSAIILLGKCRYCRQPFGMHYALIELLSAFFGIMLFHEPILWCTGFIFLFLSCEDAYNCSIHITILLPWLLYLIILTFKQPHHFFLASIIFIICFVLARYRRTLGYGDIPVILTLIFINSVTGFALTLLCTTFFSILFLKLCRIKRIPFVPFLLIGWLIYISSKKAITYFFQ